MEGSDSEQDIGAIAAALDPWVLAGYSGAGATRERGATAGEFSIPIDDPIPEPFGLSPPLSGPENECRLLLVEIFACAFC